MNKQMKNIISDTSIQEIAFSSEIKSSLRSIDQLKKDLKEKRAVLKNAFESDAIYKDAMDKVKEVKKSLTGRRDQLANTPEFQSMKEDIKMVQEEMKDVQLSLSDYLFSYVSKTNMQTIEDYNGEIRTITKTFSTKKK